jgi:RNA polymerase sigma-70 factor (ECF subfamily)
MLLVDARRNARVDDTGAFVRLAEQDRGRWNSARIAEGQQLLRECLARNRPGPYQLQAAINAVHSDARSASETDWHQIVASYDQLLALSPSPVVALNRAVAVAEIEGAERGLQLLDELDLPRYHLFHAVRADLLRRLDCNADAAAAYQAAIFLCENAREKDFLQRRCDSLTRN